MVKKKLKNGQVKAPRGSELDLDREQWIKFYDYVSGSVKGDKNGGVVVTTRDKKKYRLKRVPGSSLTVA